jgi:hypothetical protein
MIPQISSEGQVRAYRVPWPLVAGAAWSALTVRPRSFARDAQRAVGTLRPGLEVLGGEHVPARGPCLVVCNHYSRPGLGAWWTALSIAAAVAARRAPEADPEMRWVMTAAWTFPESRWRRRVLTPLTRWAFARAARAYGFVAMPPMPPDPEEVEARAAAVRQTIRLARRAAAEGGMIGLAPEGMDAAQSLGRPPAGAGSFVALLARAGLPVLPAGVAEREGRLCVSFGPVYQPAVPPDRALRDQAVAEQVMASITAAIAAAVEANM